MSEKPIRWHLTLRRAKCRRSPASVASTTCRCTSSAALLPFVLVMMLVAARGEAERAGAAREKAGNTSMFAKEIVGDKMAAR
jgi:hypothetical protein